MSDGSTTVGRPDAIAAREAKRQNVPVSTIAFGTDHGSITIANPNGSGEPITQEVDVNTAALKDIADATGGKAFTAASETELKQVYSDLGSSVGFVVEFREIVLWFVGVAFVFLLASSLMSLLWFSRLP
jgi:Ca-activated chloride channel family protein